MKFERVNMAQRRALLETGKMLVMFHKDCPVAIGKANGYGDWHISKELKRCTKAWVTGYLRLTLKVPATNIKRVGTEEIAQEFAQL